MRPAASSCRRAPTALTSIPPRRARASRGGRPRCPASGEAISIPIAIGASLMPGRDRVVALDALEVEDEHEQQREARQAVDERRRGRGREQAVLEDREVEHRRACAALDQRRTAAAARRAATRPPIVSGSFQPSRPAARDAEHEPGEPDDERQHVPGGRSRARGRAWPARAGSSHAQSEPSSANGTLNQNTQCQEIATSAPPSTGPSTRPTAATIVFVPIARPSCSRGNASVTSAAALANRNAPPMPCSDPPQDQLGAVAGEAGAERGEPRRPRSRRRRRCLRPNRSDSRPAREHEHGRGDHVGEDHPDERAGCSCAALRSRSGSAMISVPELIVASSMPEARARERPPLVVLVPGVDAEPPRPRDGRLFDRPWNLILT